MNFCFSIKTTSLEYLGRETVRKDKTACRIEYNLPLQKAATCYKSTYVFENLNVVITKL
jgi:hypothetical protein